ncbi:LANO_0D05732g1_1 [Lachancea nothofagi CBS 11611]|uniref:Transcription factor BYE1 n=1 Tax=Lachancea nothofagi CBS 11611 TaxID=1266666 RepID=A0A1G4JGY5_9SACH|nr:LANO_0D05732g1_1 [Lachancea nothofagi CBS 11611]
MSEKIRRSSRSNKGTNKYLQNQRLAELEYVKARQAHHDNTEGNEGGVEVVKCLVCGTTDDNYDEENDPNGDMIQCDTCNTWQHIKCMTGGESAEGLDNYECSLCSPSSHPDLEYVIDPATWQKKSRAKVRERDDDESNYEGNEPQGDQEDIPDEVVRRPTKRKKDDRSGKKKLHPNHDQESKLRDSALKMFGELFTRYVIPETVAAQKFHLPPKTSVKELSEKLAGELEQELYAANHNQETTNLNDSYKEKVRVLYSNLKDKKNINMKTLVINEVLSFSKLVKMSVNELVNPDLQHFRERVDSEALNQLVVEQPHKPMYHKTHKGEELIEDPNAYEPEDIIFNKDILAAKLEARMKDSENAVGGDTPAEETSKNQGVDADGNAHNSEIPRKISEPENSWKCSMEYKEIHADFSGTVDYIGSSEEISNTVRRDAIGDGAFVMEGRLKDEDAESYLQQMSSSRTFVAYLLKPQNNAHDSGQFEELYEFLQSRQRYGALMSKRKYVRHVYVIPCTAGDDLKVFNYFKSLRDQKDLIQENSFLVVAIVRTDMLDVT